MRSPDSSEGSPPPSYYANADVLRKAIDQYASECGSQESQVSSIVNETQERGSALKQIQQKWLALNESNGKLNANLQWSRRKTRVLSLQIQRLEAEAKEASASVAGLRGALEERKRIDAMRGQMLEELESRLRAKMQVIEEDTWWNHFRGPIIAAAGAIIVAFFIHYLLVLGELHALRSRTL
ncbi:hypothetical protein SeMB42_g03209 [Synchytrium endobioticum]|uniref:Uncharacterized protein n=1 Tax=Synchytrium endobioticum TaxID=286115 RepID=A0A507D8E4_9FUNG|nr:hypothetical protein SeMB42_g03209 [Synchytrium endobioticum]